MIDWLRDLIVNRYLQSIVRHVMTVVAGWLAAIGVASETVTAFTDSATQVAIAILIWLLAQGWSLLDKKK